MIRTAGAVLSVAALVLAACTFERRPDPDRRSEGDTTGLDIRVQGRGAADDSVRAVLAAFRQALRQGDVTRVAQLTSPSAVLVDQEENIRWSRTEGREARLPPPLDGSREGLGWVLDDSSLEVLGETALLVSRYTATVSAETVPWSAAETYVFVRTPEGWRLRHFHRSRGLSDALPRE